MKIFITGATGFIGRELIKKLKKEKYQITALARDKSKAELLKKQGVKTVIGDLLKPETFTKELNSNDVFIHLAAIRANWNIPSNFLEVNAHVLKKLITPNSQLKHIIDTSSVYVYGRLKDHPTDENSPLLAKDIYGKSKIIAENNLQEVCLKYGIPYTVIRPAIVYGPNDTELGMVTKMVELIKKNKFPIIGSGNNLLHLVYIDDLTEAYIKAIKKGGQNQTYLIASSKPIKLIDLVNLVKKNLKIFSKSKTIPKFPLQSAAFVFETLYKLGYQISPQIFRNEPPLTVQKVITVADNWHYNINKAKKELGYNPKVDYQQGIQKTLAKR